MSKLYLPSGYINQKWIDEVADKNRINYIIELGGRQVGKTFGTLQLMLNENRRFVLMRRTQTEADFICNDLNNPFTVFDDYDITVKKDSKYTGAIYLNTPDSDPRVVGSVMSLSTVAKIRGFNGSAYTDLVFDEFIPESHVAKIKNEDDAFYNAVTTISGAREENGKKPLRVWLLANPNTIDNAILQALNISVKVEEMENKGQELSILPDRGIMIVKPNSEAIMDRRKNNALYRAIGQTNKFTEMSLGNQFSYNDTSDVLKVKLSSYVLRYVVAGLGVYEHKTEDRYYITDYIKGTVKPSRVFQNTEKDTEFFRASYPEFYEYYMANQMNFSDLTVKSRFLDIIN